MPESPRWLIDVGKDVEGMRIIADLHGGDPENAVARAEFQEIKGKVMEEVGGCTMQSQEMLTFAEIAACIW